MQPHPSACLCTCPSKTGTWRPSSGEQVGGGSTAAAVLAVLCIQLHAAQLHCTLLKSLHRQQLCQQAFVSAPLPQHTDMHRHRRQCT